MHSGQKPNTEAQEVRWHVDWESFWKQSVFRWPWEVSGQVDTVEELEEDGDA